MSSARDIFNALLLGDTVRMHKLPQEEEKRLLGALRVFKSRHNKAVDNPRFLITQEFGIVPTEEDPSIVEVVLRAPKLRTTQYTLL